MRTNTLTAMHYASTSKTYDRLVELCRIAKALHPTIQIRNPYARTVDRIRLDHLGTHEQEQARTLFIEVCEALTRLNHIHRIEVRKNRWETCREDVTNALALLQRDVFPHSLLKEHHRQLHDALRAEYGEGGSFHTRDVERAFLMPRRTLQRHLSALVKARYLRIVGGGRHCTGYIYELVGLGA